MVTGIEPITLPWKRPEKGVSAAELGASFRVEQREDGWHCTVRVGRRAEVLATGMRRLRDAQCRAEAHAATLPEVAAALAEAQAAKVATRGKTPERPAAATRPTFEEVSDGCICGKIDSGTWIADPAGKVSVPAGTDPELAQEICRVAAKHYTARREADIAAKTVARSAATKTVAKPAAAKAVAKVATKTAAKPAAKGKAAAKSAAKPAAKGKAAAKTAAKPAAAETAAKTVAKTRGKTATKTATKVRGRAANKAAKLEAEAASSERGTGRRAPARGRGGKQAKAKPAAATKEEPVGRKAGKAKGEGCGCVTWTEAEGKARGEAKHGAFVVEPEGKRHALYFYDLDGQSRHLQSGEAGKLRKVAEEMAARGQPAPSAASTGTDAALLKMFMAGAMEDEA